MARVYWIGGPPDYGKTTLANRLGERYGLPVYHYDHQDLDHHERLAQVNLGYQAYLSMSLVERWIVSSPEALFERWLKTCRDRFPLVLQDIEPMANNQPLLVEGFGFLPELLVPLLALPDQAVWLSPTLAFQTSSFRNRGKPSFTSLVADPVRARKNIFQRDRLIADYLREEAARLGCAQVAVDGTRTPQELASDLAGRLGLTRLAGRDPALQ